MENIFYKRQVLSIYPTAKVYHTATILHSLKVYHVGVKEGDYILILALSHQFSGNRNHAWKQSYEYLKKIGKL